MPRHKRQGLGDVINNQQTVCSSGEFLFMWEEAEACSGRVVDRAWAPARDGGAAVLLPSVFGALSCASTGN
jgi:hypothetical protein